jgi:hypothetical protein
LDEFCYFNFADIFVGLLNKERKEERNLKKRKKEGGRKQRMKERNKQKKNKLIFS